MGVIDCCRFRFVFFSNIFVWTPRSKILFYFATYPVKDWLIFIINQDRLSHLWMSGNKLFDQCSVVVALYDNVFTCRCDGEGSSVLQSIQGSCWHIDASWLNVNKQRCHVCQRDTGCNLSAEPARSPNDIIKKCRQQHSNKEWSDAWCFTSLLCPLLPFVSVAAEH